nr:MAG TPA: hypothetical protein [Bacteriophage sp.]
MRVKKDETLVHVWILEHREELEIDWELCKNNQQPFRIE